MSAENTVLLHENKFFNIYRGKSHYLSYHRNDKGIQGGIVLVFNKSKTKMLLLKIYRDAIKQDSWEIPRGGAEDGESYLDCAKREGEEETGYEITNLKPLGKVAPETGTMSSSKVIYMGEVDEESTPKKVDTDDLISDMKWFTIDEVLAMIKNDEIICGWTISSMMKYLLSNNKL